MKAYLEQLVTLPGVAALCVHRGPNIIWKRLPADFSAESAEALCQAVYDGFFAYASAERFLTEAYFGFSGQSVLAIAKPPAQPGEAASYFLSFLLTDPAAAATVSKPAAAVLAEHPELKNPLPHLRRR